MSWNNECEGQDSNWNKLEFVLYCVDTKCKQVMSLSLRTTKLWVILQEIFRANQHSQTSSEVNFNC